MEESNLFMNIYFLNNFYHFKGQKQNLCFTREVNHFVLN